MTKKSLRRSSQALVQLLKRQQGLYRVRVLKGNCLPCTRMLSHFSHVPLFVTPPGSSVHGISQARILEWVALPSSRGPSQPRDWTQVSCLLHWQTDSLPLAPPGRHLINICWMEEHNLMSVCENERERSRWFSSLRLTLLPYSWGLHVR